MTDQPSSTPSRYSTAAIALHWLLAALLALQLALGWRLEDMGQGAAAFAAFQLHKSIGIAILLLSLARLSLRIALPPPPPLPDKVLNLRLAKAVHWLFYLVMIGGPVSGWIIASTARIKVPTLVFGVLPWPHLPLGRGWHEPAEVAHGALGWLLAGLVLLHVAGALRHHWLREDLIGRMLPRGLREWRVQSLTVAAALTALGAAFAFAQTMPFGSGGAQSAAPGAAKPAIAPKLAEPVPTATPSPAATPSAQPSEEPTDEALPAALWQVEPGGRLSFRADYSGSPVDGSFKRWDASIKFSPDDLAGSSIRVSVDLGSVDTADADRDENLRSDGFFDVAAHPRAVFSSRAIRHRGGDRYEAAGTLAMHGVSVPLTLPFTVTIDGSRANASGSARLSRTAFGVGSGQWADTGAIADAVAVNFRLKARKK
jgi:cytochrome b561/polyisoprenoid-binding protein YceI